MELIPSLLLDLLLGFFAGASARSTLVRFLAWWLIPFVLAVLVVGPGDLFSAQGESSMLWLVFGYRLLLGCILSGVGIMLGYILCRSAKREA